MVCLLRHRFGVSISGKNSTLTCNLVCYVVCAHEKHMKARIQAMHDRLCCGLILLTGEIYTSYDGILLLLP